MHTQKSVTTRSVFIPRGKNGFLIQITEIMKFRVNIPNTPVDSYENDSHAVFHAPCIPRIVSSESLHVTLDGNATGFHKDASHTTLQNQIVSAETNGQFSQHSLNHKNELLLGKVTLTPISSQLSYIAQQAHQRFAQAAVRFKGQRNKQVPRGPLASVLAALLFFAMGRGGTNCVCRSTAEGAGAWAWMCAFQSDSSMVACRPSSQDSTEVTDADIPGA
jgi:hypothetical protein